MLEAKGVNGQLVVDGDWMTIIRKGFGAKLTQGWTKGEKRIAIGTITSVQLKKPGLARGYIQFSFGGGIERTKGLTQGASDENTVLFNSKHQPQFEAVRSYIEEYISRKAAPGGSSSPDPLDQLKKLAELRDAGIVSPEEFEAKKKALLDL
jgi:hypothetical protein